MDAIISLAKIKGQQGYFFAGTFLNYANGLTFVLLPFPLKPILTLDVRISCVLSSEDLRFKRVIERRNNSTYEQQYQDTEKTEKAYKVSPLRIAERKTELYYKSRFRKGHHLFFGISMTDTSLKANGNNSGNALSSEGDSAGNSSVTRSLPATGSTMESTESEFVTKWHN
ncbi:hypothetical protein GQX74_009379 [Glossina fuscipes]|nr:hypothetical protein GQX74_009379 [Glossina fuscipes]